MHGGRSRSATLSTHQTFERDLFFVRILVLVVAPSPWSKDWWDSTLSGPEKGVTIHNCTGRGARFFHDGRDSFKKASSHVHIGSCKALLHTFGFSQVDWERNRHDWKRPVEQTDPVEVLPCLGSPTKPAPVRRSKRISEWSGMHVLSQMVIFEFRLVIENLSTKRARFRTVMRTCRFCTMWWFVLSFRL